MISLEQHAYPLCQYDDFFSRTTRPATKSDRNHTAFTSPSRTAKTAFPHRSRCQPLRLPAISRTYSLPFNRTAPGWLLRNSPPIAVSCPHCARPPVRRGNGLSAAVTAGAARAAGHTLVIFHDFHDIAQHCGVPARYMTLKNAKWLGIERQTAGPGVRPFQMRRGD